ncbi:MAG: AarF/ABC1/UbiB kinase family protein [Bacteroidetes bacterium]|nr:MAG: AarF/ABC1/UbiB kinase family protein [Bacteroidota bacterium]
MVDDAQEFPASKIDRGKIFARTGLKVGANYARYLVNRTVDKDKTDEHRRDLNSRNARDLFREFTRLRGTALKMAQSMSLDTGVLPDEFVDVMTQAQYNVPPMNRALVRRLIKTELGQYPEQVFATFEPEAVAAASIGQVHRATLPDGRAVAVKVQYPNVRETIKSDLAIARSLLKRLVKGHNLDAYFDEVYETLLAETDYRVEGEHIAFFATQYAHERIVTPTYLPDLSTEHVLTMTYVEGEHLDAFLARRPGQDEIDHFGQVLWDFIHEQIASNVRTVHADVHPGNFLFRADGTLGVLDFGCVKTFPQDFRDNFLRVFRAQLDGDEASMVRLYQALEILDPATQTEAQKTRLIDFLRRFGQVILTPYHTSTFDFGRTDFKTRLNALFKEASTFNEAVGSRHFIFVNRMLIGLFTLLLRLKPRIDTRYSMELLDATIDAMPT